MPLRAIAFAVASSFVILSETCESFQPLSGRSGGILVRRTNPTPTALLLAAVPPDNGKNKKKDSGPAAVENDFDIDDEDFDIEEAQRQIDEFVRLQAQSESQSKGMFNWDNFDESKIPVPIFTASLIFVGSCCWTGLLLYYGLFGIPENDPLAQIIL